MNSLMEDTSESLLTRTSIHVEVAADSPLISDEAMNIFQWVIFTFICQIIDIFGIVTNVINIICFVKQGFKDSINVSLLGLAVSDICSLSTLVWANICLSPAFSSLDLPFETTELQYLSCGIPHTTFTRITAWITALVSIEKCMCIVLPLKVKVIITSKRTCSIIVSISAIIIFSSAPLYVVNRLDLKFYPDRNKTLLGLVSTEDRAITEQFSYPINNVFIPFTAFVLIVVCTITLVAKLQNKTKWLKTSTTSIQADKTSNRNQKAAKMVVVISILFIVCFAPVSIMFIAMSLEPRLSVDGKYRNTVLVIAGFCVVFESINSSVNVFVYYYMSTRYRTIFRQLFGTCVHVSKTKCSEEHN